MVVALASGHAHADEAGLPEWVRVVTGYYVDGLISENEFVAVVQWLMDRGIVPREGIDLEDPELIGGIMDRVIDGNTVQIDDTRIRLPFVDVVDSGNMTAPHAVLARVLCPVGSYAYYDVDDLQPTGYYGRTIAMVYCSDGILLDRMMVEFGLGWVNQDYCERSEFRHVPWANACSE
jgi:hypothetical protein